VALTGVKPLAAILFAQYANGMLLPLLALVLVWLANRSHILGEAVNHRLFNGLAMVVVLICLTLGYAKLA